jgi:alpha-D-ribose 1-methylphosphonate 5-phosphate C-P lyase
MTRLLRWTVAVVALTASFGAGRLSTHGAVPKVAETVSLAPEPQPWAVQGFRGAECQVLGDIPECD